MPILKNRRRELLAQGLAKGMALEDAYKAAGYKPHRQNAHRMAAEDDIKERVAEILGRAAERAGITAQNVLDELAKIGFCNMQDYMRAGPDGDPYLDFSQLTRDQAAALSEVTVEDFKEGRGENARDVRRVKFKLADKRAALVDIGRYLGMFVDRSENVNKNYAISDEPPSEEEWKRKHVTQH